MSTAHPQRGEGKLLAVLGPLSEMGARPCADLVPRDALARGVRAVPGEEKGKAVGGGAAGAAISTFLITRLFQNPGDPSGSLKCC